MVESTKGQEINLLTSVFAPTQGYSKVMVRSQTVSMVHELIGTGHVQWYELSRLEGDRKLVQRSNRDLRIMDECLSLTLAKTHEINNSKSEHLLSLP